MENCIVDIGAYEASGAGLPGDCDGDGVPDGDDVCPGFDDNIDSDGDGMPDGCDSCSVLILYVNADAPAGGDGSSWLTAFMSLQFALAAAAECPDGVDDIWVAAGSYRPSRLTDPGDAWMATFQLISGVALYDEFAGGETQRGQRDSVANETILSGVKRQLPVPVDGNYSAWESAIISHIPLYFCFFFFL